MAASLPKRALKALRKQDIFGHHVQLNFARNGSVHTTALGGFLSIVLKVAYAGYLALLIKTMVTHDDARTYELEFEHQ